MMSKGAFTSSLIAQLWRIFEVPTPLFGLTFADILLGTFVVGVSLLIISMIYSVTLRGISLQNRYSGFWKEKYSPKKKGK